MSVHPLTSGPSFPLGLIVRIQAAEHVFKLTLVFTSLVLIAATQGK